MARYNAFHFPKTSDITVRVGSPATTGANCARPVLDVPRVVDEADRARLRVSRVFNKSGTIAFFRQARGRRLRRRPPSRSQGEIRLTTRAFVMRQSPRSALQSHLGRHEKLCAQRPAIYGPAFRSDWRPMSEMYQFASAQDAGEKDALELRDRGDLPPALREKDRSLQGR